ncbi:hypothetical protein [Corallincola holothuriorum]|uniref:hypothetical protein n=1 Tax=Corallincola holothuriorum TaxID=2282215 RepID=UPI0011C04C7D|nr:hypothetical protein [Corallincola holothuriorum]
MKFIKACVLVSGLLFITLFYLERLENPSITFQNFDELQASGLIESGWLPAYFPRSSTNIKEQHNIDTNEVNATFQYKASDLINLLKHCHLIEKTEQSQKLLCNSRSKRTNTFTLNNDGAGEFHSSYNGI